MMFANKDVNTSIFSQLDSYDRAIICSVSKWFASESLRVSVLLTLPNNRRVYKYIECSILDGWSTTLDDYLGTYITKKMYIDIASDAHLLMRLKNKHRHIFYGIGICGNINTINMVQNISSCEKYNLKNGLAYAGHTQLLMDQFNINDGYIEYDYIIYQAAKGGRIDTLKGLKDAGYSCDSHLIYGGCKANNRAIIDMVPRPWKIKSWRSAFVGAAKGDHLELLKEIVKDMPVNALYPNQWIEARRGAESRSYDEVYKYLVSIEPH